MNMLKTFDVPVLVLFFIYENTIIYTDYGEIMQLRWKLGIAL